MRLICILFPFVSCLLSVFVNLFSRITYVFFLLSCFTKLVFLFQSLLYIRDYVLHVLNPDREADKVL